MIAFGVAAGATTPMINSASRLLKPLSVMVGTSGTIGERFALVTASARSLPALTCWTAVAMLSNATSKVPPSSSGIIWPLPR